MELSEDERGPTLVGNYNLLTSTKKNKKGKISERIVIKQSE